MSQLEKYSAYKDSGVEWLGEIPEHWEVKKLKLIAKNKTIKSIESDFKIALENIESQTTKYIETQEIVFSEAGISFKKGDVLFSKLRPYLAKVYLAEEDGLCVSEFLVLESKKIKSIFLKYMLVSYSCIEHINSSTYGTKMPRASWNFIGNSLAPIPPKQEQTQIATYLDQKTSQIDKAITQKEKLIALLKEQKQITINEAVTKGLDKNVTLKDSGVEWIGEIPEHWEILKVKNVFNLIIDPAPKNNNEELLSIYTDIGVKPRKELAEKGNKASTTDGYWKVKKGDFIVNKLLAWMGAIGISKYNGVTSPAYDILRAKVPISGIFYHELFRLKVFSEEMKKHSRGIMEMRLRLYFDKFGDILIPYPAYEEQLQIVEYIETQTSKIDKAINLQQNYISKLKEYKASLIDSVVTGKVKVSS